MAGDEHDSCFVISFGEESVVQRILGAHLDFDRLFNIFNPEMIINGGGIAKMGDLLLNPAKQVVRERAFRLSAQAVQIVPAQLGDDAGVLGAAVLAFQQEVD